MEIKEVLDEKGEVQGWVLWVGDVPIFCETKEEAEEIRALLEMQKNEEILEALVGMLRTADKDNILETLSKQHRVFVMLLFVMLDQDAVWSNGMAIQQLRIAIDFCVGLQTLCRPAPQLTASGPRG